MPIVESSGGYVDSEEAGVTDHGLPTGLSSAEGNIDGFPLAAGETISIMTDNPTKVTVWIPTTADGFSWIAIEQARAVTL